MAQEGEEVAGRVGQRGGGVAGPDRAHHRGHEVRDEVAAELLPGQELPQGELRRPGFRLLGEQGAGPAVEAHHLEQHQQVAAAQQGGGPGKDAAALGPGPGVLQAAAVAADGHAHFRVLGFNAQFGEEPQQCGVGPFVVDDEARVDPQHGTAGLRHVVGVGVAAEPWRPPRRGSQCPAGSGRTRRSGPPRRCRSRLLAGPGEIPAASDTGLLLLALAGIVLVNRLMGNSSPGGRRMCATFQHFASVQCARMKRDCGPASPEHAKGRPLINPVHLRTLVEVTRLGLLRGGRHPARLHGVGRLPADVGAGTRHRRRTVPALGPQHPAHRSGPGDDPARGQGPHGHRGADGGGLPHRGHHPAGTPAGHLPQPGHLCAAADPGEPGLEEARHRPAGLRGRARPDHPGPAHRRRTRRRPRVPGGAVRASRGRTP